MNHFYPLYVRTYPTEQKERDANQKRSRFFLNSYSPILILSGFNQSLQADFIKESTLYTRGFLHIAAIWTTMKPDISSANNSKFPSSSPSAARGKKVGEANIFPDKDKFTIMSWENSSLGSLPLLPYNGRGDVTFRRALDPRFKFSIRLFCRITTEKVILYADEQRISPILAFSNWPAFLYSTLSFSRPFIPVLA